MLRVFQNHLLKVQFPKKASQDVMRRGRRREGTDELKRDWMKKRRELKKNYVHYYSKFWGPIFFFLFFFFFAINIS